MRIISVYGNQMQNQNKKTQNFGMVHMDKDAAKIICGNDLVKLYAMSSAPIFDISKFSGVRKKRLDKIVAEYPGFIEGTKKMFAERSPKNAYVTEKDVIRAENYILRRNGDAKKLKKGILDFKFDPLYIFQEGQRTRLTPYLNEEQAKRIIAPIELTKSNGTFEELKGQLTQTLDNFLSGFGKSHPKYSSLNNV